MQVSLNKIHLGPNNYRSLYCMYHKIPHTLFTRPRSPAYLYAHMSARAAACLPMAANDCGAPARSLASLTKLAGGNAVIDAEG